MKKGQADVVIINWNGRRYLPECLDSVMNQSYRHATATLVDNYSSDGSVEYVSRRFKGVKIIALNDNIGFAAANNRGITSSSGEFVALLNNDAVAHPDWLKMSVECLNRYRDAGFCASKIVDYYHRDILDTAGDIYTSGGVNAKRGLGKKIDLYAHAQYVFGACAAAAVYRRQMLEEIGLFDEDFFIMCEDVDLSFRAQLAGHKCIYCPQSIVYHKTHGTIKDVDTVFSYYGQRNSEYVFLKNMPLGLLITSFPSHIVYNLFVSIYFLLKGQWLSFLKAKFSFLLNIRKVLRKRAEIRKTVKVTEDYIGSLLVKGWLFDKIKTKVFARWVS